MGFKIMMPKEYRTKNIRAMVFMFTAIAMMSVFFWMSAGISWGATFISISDFHFNPFYDPSILEALEKTESGNWDSVFQRSHIKGLGDYGNGETNYNLFISALKSMGNSGCQPDFVLFTGDILAHEFNARFRQLRPASTKKHLDRFILKTVQFVINRISRVFPSAEIFFTLGNTDAYSGDYGILPGGKFLRDTSKAIYEEFLKGPKKKELFLNTYGKGGYYSKLLQGSQKARIISLNTVFFSVKYRHAFSSGAHGDPAKEALVWLEQELKAASRKGESVWLLLHIPPGVDVYGTLREYPDHSGKLTGVSLFWKPQYLQTFQRLIRSYSKIIRATFAGHTHMDTFRLMGSTDVKAKDTCFIHVSPAISPQFGNNPGYEVFAYDKKDFTVKGYEVFYLDLEDPAVHVDTPWTREYSFTEIYGIPSMSGASLKRLWLRLEKNPPERSLWMKYFNVSHTSAPAITLKNWKGYWLGMGALDEKRYLTSFNR